MDFVRGFVFASDAAVLTAWGAGFILLALMALFMDRRRLKRREINRVGWVPWTPIFLACAVIGGGILAVSVPGLIAS